ncbi:chitinase [Streptomyces violascens]|uniref:chitinase n=1 Tax=Streptomyces violascens TaxID=67381 RepID=UPI003662E6E1
MTDLAPGVNIDPPFAAEVPECGDWDVPRAPYVDYTAYPTPEIVSYANESGVDGFIVGFLSTTAGGDKNLHWGGYVPHADAGMGVLEQEALNTFADNGGRLVLSFGGASNVPLEAEETDVDSIVASYQEVLDNYQVTRLDFSFEGALLHDAEGLARHIAAMGELLRSNADLKLSYTLPADGAPGSLEGFNTDGVGLLRALAAAGIQPSLINGMLMEFGQTSPPDAFEASRIALKAMAKQIQDIWPAWDSAKVWRRIGATPMFGRNNNGKTFTLTNMKQLAAFATEKNLGCLSGWDATRDYNQGTLPDCSVEGGSNLTKCTGVKQKTLAFTKIITRYKK